VDVVYRVGGAIVILIGCMLLFSATRLAAVSLNTVPLLVAPNIFIMGESGEHQSYSVPINVTDTNNKPVENAFVFIRYGNTYSGGYTDNNGNVVLSYEGWGYLVCYKKGYLMYVSGVTIASSQPISITLKPIPTGKNSFAYRGENNVVDFGLCDENYGKGSYFEWYRDEARMDVYRGNYRIYADIKEKSGDVYDVNLYVVSDNTVIGKTDQIEIKSQIVGNHIEGTVSCSLFDYNYKAYDVCGDLLITAGNEILKCANMGYLVSGQLQVKEKAKLFMVGAIVVICLGMLIIYTGIKMRGEYGE